MMNEEVIERSEFVEAQFTVLATVNLLEGFLEPLIGYLAVDLR